MTEMKANFNLPEEADPWVDEIMWIEFDRQQADPLITKYVFVWTIFILVVTCCLLLSFVQCSCN